VVILGYGITLIVAYLLGSIPTGFLVAKARGIDIRTVGSGNIGATNVFRYLGKPAGIFVLLVDALKGWLAAYYLVIFMLHAFFPGRVTGVFAKMDSQTFQDSVRVTAGIGAILGHNFTCWLHFKGGKGIATSAGVLIALVWPSLLIILAVWIAVFVLTRYVSLASVCASAMLPFAAWFTRETPAMVGVTAAMGALAIYKHRGNIKRLLNGTENRISFKKRTTPSPGGPSPG
jgi:glycerol-3-phosphate acyltransferase PlsY